MPRTTPAFDADMKRAREAAQLATNKDVHYCMTEQEAKAAAAPVVQVPLPLGVSDDGWREDEQRRMGALSEGVNLKGKLEYV